MLSEPIQCMKCEAVSINGGYLACCSCYADLETRVKKLTDERDRLKNAYGSLREDIMKAPIMPRNVWDYTRDALARAEAVRKGG